MTSEGKGRGPLIAGLGCLAISTLCCISGVVVVWYANTQVGRISPAAVACDGAAVEGATPYLPGAAPSVAGFQRGSQSWTYAGSMVPRAWNEVEDVADVQVVLCFEDATRERIQTCPYEGGTILNRYVQVRDVRAVEATTGQTIFTRRLRAPAPDACPEAVSSTEIYGIDVSTNERESEGPDVGAREIGELGPFFLRGETLPEAAPGAAPVPGSFPTLPPAGGPSPNPGLVMCDNRARLSVCQAFGGDSAYLRTLGPEMAQQICGVAGGRWDATETCPATNRVGRCQDRQGVTSHYYAEGPRPFTAAMARTACTGGDGAGNTFLEEP